MTKAGKRLIAAAKEARNSIARITVDTDPRVIRAIASSVAGLANDVRGEDEDTDKLLAAATAALRVAADEIDRFNANKDTDQ